MAAETYRKHVIEGQGGSGYYMDRYGWRRWRASQPLKSGPVKVTRPDGTVLAEGIHYTDARFLIDSERGLEETLCDGALRCGSLCSAKAKFKVTTLWDKSLGNFCGRHVQPLREGFHVNPL